MGERVPRQLPTWLLTGLLGLAMVAPAQAQLACPDNQKECNNRCVPVAQQCVLADESNKFFLLGVVVAVGALIGLGFYLNPDDDETDAAGEAGATPKAFSPVDFSVHENGGGLILRGTF